MRQYDDNDGWRAMVDDLRFTVAMLQASEVHDDLAHPLQAHTETWNTLEHERDAAELAVVKADARVAWCNVVLDRCTTRFATQLLADCEGNRAHPMFVAFFPTAPTQVTRMALPGQLAAMEKFPTLAESETLKKPTRGLLQQVLGAMARGEEALAARKTVSLAVVAVGRRQTAWREEANRLRRSAKTALDDHANKNHLPRDYADAFFATQASTKKRARNAAPPETSDAGATHEAGTTVALSEVDRVLALSDRALRALADEFIATLPANAQSIVRARRSG